MKRVDEAAELMSREVPRSLIAEKMGVKVTTVDTWIYRIRQKLGCQAV